MPNGTNNGAHAMDHTMALSEQRQRTARCNGVCIGGATSIDTLCTKEIDSGDMKTCEDFKLETKQLKIDLEELIEKYELMRQNL